MARATTLRSLETAWAISPGRAASVFTRAAMNACSFLAKASGEELIIWSRMASAWARTLSGVAVGPKNSTLMNGRASITISRPTLSGWRAARATPASPPREWPITAGAFSPAASM